MGLDITPHTRTLSENAAWMPYFLKCGSLPDLSWFLQRWVVELAIHNHRLDRIHDSLTEQDISHILYNRGYFKWVLKNTTIPVQELVYSMTQLDIFIAKYGDPVLTIGGTKLVALRAQ